MAAKVPPIPAGYHSITPYMIVDGASRAIEFYTSALGATEVMRIPGPGGKIGHAELKIGDSHIMLADEHPELGYRGPKALGGSPVSIALYVEDVDHTIAHALREGATLTRPVQNQFYGDRSGTIEDPFGHTWHIATHVEDVSPEEMAKRAAERARAQGQ